MRFDISGIRLFWTLGPFRYSLFDLLAPPHVRGHGVGRHSGRGDRGRPRSSLAMASSIEPQLSLALMFVRPVTGETMLRQDGLDLAVEVNLRRFGRGYGWRNSYENAGQ